MSTTEESGPEDGVPPANTRVSGDSEFQPPSSSAASTSTIDSTQKITLVETHVAQDRWSQDTETHLLNTEGFKEKERAKHWSNMKQDLKSLVARVRSETTSRKFELEVKCIGPTSMRNECISGIREL